jgi:hypothetical protein
VKSSYSSVTCVQEDDIRFDGVNFESHKHCFFLKLLKSSVLGCSHVQAWHHSIWNVTVRFFSGILLVLRRVAHHPLVTDQATQLSQRSHRVTLKTITLNRVASHLHVFLLHSNHNPPQLVIPTARVLPTVDLHHSLDTSEMSELRKWNESTTLP